MNNKDMPAYPAREKICFDIIEQHAIFDGKPDFSVPLAAIINLLNWHSDGGTPSDMVEARKHMKEPRRYKVTLRLDYEDVTDKAALAELNKQPGGEV